MARIGRVGHVVLRVTDVAAAEAFYRDALGMETVRRSEGAAFMSFGTQHHDIGLFSVNGEHTRGNVGLGHVALVVDGGMADLEELHRRLLDNGVEIASLTDHGMTKSVYFNDPDGNRLEIYVDLMAPEDGKRFLSERVGSGNNRFTFEEAGVHETAAPQRESRKLDEILTRNFKDVPTEEWDRLPSDLTAHLDHHLHGADRR